jgi:hypothetical protein
MANLVLIDVWSLSVDYEAIPTATEAVASRRIVMPLASDVPSNESKLNYHWRERALPRSLMLKPFER